MTPVNVIFLQVIAVGHDTADLNWSGYIYQYAKLWSICRCMYSSTSL